MAPSPEGIDGDSTGVELSIVVALYNEAPNVGPFLEACDPVVAALPVAGHEYVFVDDGSSDETWDTVARIAASRTDVRGVRLARNVGKEAALTAGLIVAAGEAHIPMDVDLQDPPTVIPELVEQWRRGAEVVLARRTDRDDVAMRRWGAQLMYSMMSRASDSAIPADVGDFRLMSREVTERFLAFRERSRYNKGLLAISTGPHSVVDYHRPEPAGPTRRASRQSPRRLVRLALDGVVSFSTWPLQLLSVVGFVLLALSGLALVLGVVLRATNVLEVPGQATVVVLVAIVLGFQSLSIGILGLYVAQILTEVKRRPLFFVSGSVGASPQTLRRLDAYVHG